MGKLLLVWRLATRDLQRRRGETILVLLAIAAAAAALTLGLVLLNLTSNPYDQTRAATAGPDIVAISASSGAHNSTSSTDRTALNALIKAPGVIGHTGPYPIAYPILRIGGQSDAVIAEGRDQAPASIDQPKVTQGSWVRSGGAVVERSFADALGIRVGDRITLNGRSFRVLGVAVTAAVSDNPDFNPYQGHPDYPNLGLVWLTQPDVHSLVLSPDELSYTLNLKLENPANAQAFAGTYDNNTASTAPVLIPWQQISSSDRELAQTGDHALLIGSWLLGILAAISLAVVVGGRLAEQTRRVGLLKAVGGTPGLIGSVLLVQYLLLALIAAAAGLAVGWLTAPLLTQPGAALLGSAGAPRITLTTFGVVASLALAVAVFATLVPALRAARTSTVSALADASRPPRRTPWLIALSAGMPVPLLLSARIAARRPRRVVLNVISIAVTVTTFVTVLMVYAHNAHASGSSAIYDPRAHRQDEVILIVTVVLVVLAAVNIIFVTWATVVDSKRPLAIARSLGATPQQLAVGLSTAQILPALAGAILGIPGGVGLYVLVSHGTGTAIPPFWQLIFVVLGVIIVVAGLTAIPARFGARRPVAELLQAESA